MHGPQRPVPRVPGAAVDEIEDVLADSGVRAGIESAEQSVEPELGQAVDGGPGEELGARPRGRPPFVEGVPQDVRRSSAEAAYSR